jgi:high affinity Mn2+ porin
MKLRLQIPILLAMAAPAAFAQTTPPAPDAAGAPTPDERWNLYYQATSIGDEHGSFPSPYSGVFSLQNYPEHDVSITATLFLGLQLFSNTQLYVNPELAGGRGFSGVNGLADSPNGELPRVASATPKPYLARAYLTHDFGFGDERESFDSDANQLAGSRPMTRYSISIGRFSVTDFFDDNAFSHDPRTQFMGWAIMYNGAWDYPADTRGYTWGWVHEFHTRNWSVRYGSAAEPKVANGMQFDRRLFRDRGDMFEGERDVTIHGRKGAVRVLGFLLHTDSGSYAEAIALGRATGTAPDVSATLQIGRLKYGTGISADQEITKDVGVFVRLGWNDGKTESFAFTAMDRLAEGGISVKGTRWRRPDDTVATAYIAGGISGVHASYLAAGGYDFLIGDGRLNYGPELVWESYYSARVTKQLTASFDLQYDTNPAYNRDRGPVWIESIRLHLEGAVKK